MSSELLESSRLPFGQYSVYFAPVTDQQLKFKINESKYFLKVVSLELHPSKCVYFDKINIHYYNKVLKTSELKLINTISLSPSEAIWLASQDLNTHSDKFLHTPLKIYATDSLTTIDKSTLNEFEHQKLYLNSYEWDTLRSFLQLITWIIKQQHKYTNDKVSIDDKKFKAIRLLHKIFYYFTLCFTDQTFNSPLTSERYHIVTLFKIFSSIFFIDPKISTNIIDTYTEHVKTFDFLNIQKLVKLRSPHFYELFIHITYSH